MFVEIDTEDLVIGTKYVITVHNSRALNKVLKQILNEEFQWL